MASTNCLCLKGLCLQQYSSWRSSQCWALKHYTALQHCCWGPCLNGEIINRHTRMRKASQRRGPVRDAPWSVRAEAREHVLLVLTQLGNCTMRDQVLSLFFFLSFFFNHGVLQINSVVLVLQVNFSELTNVYAWNPQITKCDCRHRWNANLKISKCLNEITSFI